MTNETTENFLKVMAEFEWPDAVVPSYRLYYNEDGNPKCYSMEDLTGKYIEVDAETFAQRPWNVRVVDGKLHVIEPPVVVQKLSPNNKLGISCHPTDVCVVVPNNQPCIKWNKIINEIN